MGLSLAQQYDRLMERTIQSDEDSCWIWVGRTSGGYGVFFDDREIRRVHRVSLEFHKGPIPEGMFACHTCDNPACVNPNHLFSGTPAENSADMARKGRAHRFIGEANPFARLTEKRAMEVIRLLHNRIPHAQIAEMVGISRRTVNDIANERTWKHLPRNQFDPKRSSRPS